MSFFSCSLVARGIPPEKWGGGRVILRLVYCVAVLGIAIWDGGQNFNGVEDEKPLSKPYNSEI